MQVQILECIDTLEMLLDKSAGFYVLYRVEIVYNDIVFNNISEINENSYNTELVPFLPRQPKYRVVGRLFRYIYVVTTNFEGTKIFSVSVVSARGIISLNSLHF